MNEHEHTQLHVIEKVAVQLKRYALLAHCFSLCLQLYIHIIHILHIDVRTFTHIRRQSHSPNWLQ